MTVDQVDRGDRVACADLFPYAVFPIRGLPSVMRGTWCGDNAPTPGFFGYTYDDDYDEAPRRTTSVSPDTRGCVMGI